MENGQKFDIAVDFDGTCVDHCYPEIGEDVPEAVRVLKKLSDAGHRLILYTMRSAHSLVYAIEWFRERNIPLFGIQYHPNQSQWTSSNKCYAHIYIDDAALGCPIKKFPGFHRWAVDWNAVDDWFFGANSRNFKESLDRKRKVGQKAMEEDTRTAAQRFKAEKTLGTNR